MLNDKQDFFHSYQPRIFFVSTTLAVVIAISGIITSAFNYATANKLEPVKDQLSALNAEVLASEKINNDQNSTDRQLIDTISRLQNNQAAIIETHKNINENEKQIIAQLNIIYARLIKWTNVNLCP